DVAQHCFGVLENLVSGLAQLHSSLEAAFECSLAAPARMHLRLDDKPARAPRKKLFREGFRRLGRIAHIPCWNWHPILGEKLFGLIFVNVHSQFRVSVKTILAI